MSFKTQWLFGENACFHWKKTKMEERVLITLCACVCRQQTWKKRSESTKYTAGCVWFWPAQPRVHTPFFNTPQLGRWELKCKVVLPLLIHLNLSLWVNFVHFTQRINPSALLLPSPPSPLSWYLRGIFRFLCLSHFSCYFSLDQWPLTPYPLLLINTLITFTFRSTDFNTYYYDPIKYCSFNLHVGEHYYFIWNPRGRQSSHTCIHA